MGTALAQTYAATTYSANGLPVTLTDAKGNRTTYEYDGHDRRVTLRYPHPTTANTSSTTDYEQYGFDAAGNLTSHRKRSGDTVTLAYDNLNRLLNRSYPTVADNVAFAYDLLGRRTQASFADASHTVAYVWDAAGRLTSTTAGGKTLAYQYDAAGNRTRLTWPETSFYVTTTYDALNRPSAIQELGTTNLATYAWDDLSRRTTVTLGNGTTTSYGYSTQGALASLSHNLAGTAQDQTDSYTRNQAQEITAHNWTNDLYQWVGAANGTQSYTANGLNQYTTAAGATLTHDAKGNLTGDGTWTYTFDADNKLKTAAKTGYSASLAYDPEGRMRRTVLAGITTDLVYDGVDLVAEYDGAGTLVRRYVHGPGIDEPLVWYEGSTTTAKSWLYADHLGSIIGTANSAGTSTAIHSYGPFGEPNVTTGVRFRYTGQQYLGGLNLYYYKARFYSPALGRFLQTDPIGYAAGTNLYAYVRNNPVNAIDPSGLVDILIPGTDISGKRDNNWFQAGSSFAGAVRNITNDPVQRAFGWSGGNSDGARQEAATELAGIVNGYLAAGEPVRIFAHSHGGNVAAIASHQFNGAVDLVVTMGTPVLDQYGFDMSKVGAGVALSSGNDSTQTNGGGSRWLPGIGEFGPAGRLRPEQGFQNIVTNGYDGHSAYWQNPGFTATLVDMARSGNDGASSLGGQSLPVFSK